MTQPLDKIFVDRVSKARFILSGKFSATDAARAMQKAAGAYLLAIRDMGGEVLDDPANYARMGRALHLPGAEGFAAVRESMLRCSWLTESYRDGKAYLAVTSIGYGKCPEYERCLRPENPDA